MHVACVSDRAKSLSPAVYLGMGRRVISAVTAPGVRATSSDGARIGKSTVNCRGSRRWTGMVCPTSWQQQAFCGGG